MNAIDGASAKRQLRYTLLLLALLAALGIAWAGYFRKTSSDQLADITIETLPDLTTAAQRATKPVSVSPDALAIAPADPADWTPLSKPIPGILIRGALAEDAQGRFLLRLPKEWNGKLVVAGASGTRSEFNGDLVISDFVLQRGYAYASQNKGVQNLVSANKNTPKACSLHPVADAEAGSPANPLIYFYLLDQHRSLQEWGERLAQAAQIAKNLIRERYGREPARTYAMGVSNGGYQVRKAIEEHPEIFDGGVEWEAVFWRAEGPNFIGELPEGLKQFPSYRDKGLDPNGAEAKAIRNAHFPPDLIENGSSLWTLNRFIFWELTEGLYVRKLDPNYSEQFPGFSAFADYDYTSRSKVKNAVHEFANSGVIRRPLISVHGTLDALIPLEGHARPYKALVGAKGFGGNYRLYEVQNGNHLDSLKGTAFAKQLPNLELIQPHAHKAFELLEAWVENNSPPPASQCIGRGGSIVGQPVTGECEELLAPP